MTERIRLAKPEEAEWLHGLLQRAYTPLVAQGINFTVSRSTVADVAAVIASESTFVLERDGQRVATLTVRFPWTQDNTQLAPWPFLHWFAVEPDYKGQGYGSRIIRYVEESFLRDTLKSPAVYLATAIKHPWLTQLYLRRGYQPFHRAINPLGVELVYLTRVLDQRRYQQAKIKEYIHDFIENSLTA
ncbi:GCN5 family acetyltransferase [bacteria symbiont BFo1 of Frankliniella occidentalis]|jgi:GNAT superfamily N-acetyltransferase|uniref:GNAT family N-acetyltransferase n=1 Tax=Erwinia aphidicola TaxID=68334 RepID=A0ABU8DLQ4_ERWAP|nr:GNAT family N-acetyltransferase [Erwinia aphidicola]KMV72280.1 GCN5 family acetyltransferase [bacteria symbiont BFo1 of Frankliniella occidentalis]PIJ56928.1 N-acetyltransferase [Erwinia sp. OLMDLW33]KYP85963.1 GCN5 family acetyltransferase [bacteria symbiont BFo1 of Frankliniella occidentalis]KYP91711.1 GCN5 family acetyltransferase [bacteria symbiont BFo1 of Frankliniella occidentalis]MBD1378369.1 GNAT family N-acetyltransferase [Erwinia aphidicola]